jgi:hypothetical protein
MSNKKVAIIFFGLTRTLGKTINSLELNLFKPLRDNSIEYDIFIHTYKIYGQYNNQWSKEQINDYENEDVDKILKPKYFICDNQEDIINSINFNEYYRKLGNWTGMNQDMTKYLIRNMCLALYSKKQITLLFEKHISDYDYAIIIRPDTQLLNKFNTNYFNELNNNNIIIPQKDWYQGCNDRICIGTPDIILYYGKLFDDLKQYSTEKSIISERYLLDKLNERNITIISKDINYNNLRINDKLNNRINDKPNNRLNNRFKNRLKNRLYNRLNNRFKK